MFLGVLFSWAGVYGTIAEFGFSSCCFGMEEPSCALHQHLPVSARSVLALEKILIAELG